MVALPNWRRPRLLVAGDGAKERWAHSAFYPAFHLPGHVLRTMLRIRAAAWAVGLPATVRPDGQDLAAFVGDLFPYARVTAALVGNPGPMERITAEIRAPDGTIVAYAKHAVGHAAISRLVRELEMLVALPSGIGPELLRHAPLDRGLVAVLRPVRGRRCGATLPPPPGIFEFLGSLTGSVAHWPEEHPWLRATREVNDIVVARAVKALQGRPWPMAVLHGDLAPWNVIDTGAGLQCVDWEFGTVQGFPHIDVAYYMLQVAALVYRLPPRLGAWYARRVLTVGRPGLLHSEAAAVVRLAALHGFHENDVDGVDRNAKLQRWRRAVYDGDEA